MQTIKIVIAGGKTQSVEIKETPNVKTKRDIAKLLRSILQNEKYKGDAVLQKTFTVDFLSKKIKPNEGEVPQFYVENSHPAIVEPEMFDMVQAEIKKRRESGRQQSGVNCFSSRIICGECDSFYGSKVWHSTSKYRRTVWQCNNKYKSKEICQTPHLSEAAVQTVFIKAFNQMYLGKDRLIAEYNAIIQVLTDTTELDKESATHLNECTVVMELIRKSVAENARITQDQDEYNKRHNALIARYETAKMRLDKIAEEKQARAAKRESISWFISGLERHDGLLEEFDEELWCETVESVMVYSEKDVAVTFKDGSVVHVDTREK